MFFVGIDLAWSYKNNSGVSILDLVNKEIFFSLKKTDEEIINYIFSIVKQKSAIIGIDAPLIVPNENGNRIAEKELNRMFSKYEASALPSNRKILSKYNDGLIRGEELSFKLSKKGFSQKFLEDKTQKKIKRVYEIYPNSAMVELFNLKKTLKYKIKNKISRLSEFNKYKKLLFDIYKKKLDLEIKFLQNDITKFSKKQLKEYEDIIDSIFISFICYRYWLNPLCFKVFGNLKEGYILTP